jgi:hypothetical protein
MVLGKQFQVTLCRMPSSGMWRHVDLVLTDVSQEHHITEDGILHSHRRENLKSYITLCTCIF